MDEKNGNERFREKDLKVIGEGSANPSAIAARNKGLPYEIVTSPSGSQTGVVTLPSGERIEAWSWYNQKRRDIITRNKNLVLQGNTNKVKDVGRNVVVNNSVPIDSKNRKVKRGVFSFGKFVIR